MLDILVNHGWLLMILALPLPILWQRWRRRKAAKANDSKLRRASDRIAVEEAAERQAFEARQRQIEKEVPLDSDLQLGREPNGRKIQYGDDALIAKKMADDRYNQVRENAEQQVRKLALEKIVKLPSYAKTVEESGVDVANAEAAAAAETFVEKFRRGELDIPRKIWLGKGTDMPPGYIHVMDCL